MAEKDLKALFLHRLKDSHHAESAIVKAGPDNQLGMSDVQDLLGETLAEQESTGELLSELTEDAINPQAV